MASQRINWVDSAKGFGILCVILGHTHIPLLGRQLIYSFHLPFFFLLSGIFLMKKAKPFKEELTNKVRSLLVPYFLFNLVLLVFFDVLLPTVHGTPWTLQDIRQTLCAIATGDRYHSGLWFLPCLFGAEMLLLLAARWLKHPVLSGLVMLGLGCLVNSFVTYPLPMSADNMLIAAGFIAVGIWFRDHDIPFSWYILLLLAAAYFTFLPLSLDSTYGKGIEMYDFRYGNYAYFLLTALSAIFFLILLFRRLPDCQPLCWLGRNSLLIYCTHTIFMQVPYAIEKRIPQFLPDAEVQALLFSLLAALFICLVSIPVVWGVNRYTPWMLGKKQSL